jgi:hypothetical protein
LCPSDRGLILASIHPSIHPSIHVKKISLLLINICNHA